MSKLFVVTITILFLVACQDNSGTPAKKNDKAIMVQYPATIKDTTVKDNYFGTIVSDPYRWLENDTSTATANWVKAENDLTQNYLAQIPFREAIKKRYESIYNYEKYNLPFKRGRYTYYSRNSGLQNQYVLYREMEGATEPEVFLDPNTFSKDGTTSLAGINFSKDGSRVAYNISEGGSDWQKLVVMDATHKKQTGDTLQLKFSGASWKGWILLLQL
jgi:prolyl oligopeptidase